MAPRYVPREQWLAGMPGTDPAGRPYSQWRPQSTSQPLNAPGADRVKGTAIHYPGSAPGTATYAAAERNPVEYVRSIHRGHRNRKPSGFDLGYGFVVVPNGDIYEGRAWYRQAAHGGDSDPGDENEQYLAIQLPVDTVRPHPNPSAQQIESVRWLIAEQRRRYPGANEISDHRTVDGPGNTSCPGEVLHRMAFDGTFEPDQGETEDMPLTNDDVAKIWNYLLPERFGQSPSEADVTVKDTRVVVSQIIAAVDTLESSMVVLNNKLEHITATLEEIKGGGGTPGDPVPLNITLTGTATPT